MHSWTVSVTLSFRARLKLHRGLVEGVFSTGHTVALVTYDVIKKTIMCSPLVGQFFDTMIVASSDNEWL